MTTGVVMTPHNLQNLARNGAPARTRTWDPRLRRPMLYPVELRAPAGVCGAIYHWHRAWATVVEMMALLDGRMRREATVAGEPALEITILADLSKLPTTFPWLSDWLSAAWCPGNLWDICVYFTNKNWSRRADSNR